MHSISHYNMSISLHSLSQKPKLLTLLQNSTWAYKTVICAWSVLTFGSKTRTVNKSMKVRIESCKNIGDKRSNQFSVSFCNNEWTSYMMSTYSRKYEPLKLLRRVGTSRILLKVFKASQSKLLEQIIKAAGKNIFCFMNALFKVYELLNR